MISPYDLIEVSKKRKCLKAKQDKKRWYKVQHTIWDFHLSKKRG